MRRDFYFLIIPQNGDAVKSLVQYYCAHDARATGQNVAQLLLRASRRQETSALREEFQPIAQQPQEYLDVVVVNATTKESMYDVRLCANQ